MQVTRGAVRAIIRFPTTPPRPTLIIITARRIRSPTTVEGAAQKGVRVITRPDERWARLRHQIDSQLLPNLLAKTAARKAGAFEAWLVDEDGYVTEGASTKAWIVDGEGRLVTRSLSNAILPGVTRRVILEAAAEAQMQVVERRSRWPRP